METIPKIVEGMYLPVKWEDYWPKYPFRITSPSMPGVFGEVVWRYSRVLNEGTLSRNRSNRCYLPAYRTPR